MRQAVQVLREMNLVKASTKGDAKMTAVLLKPLEEELQAIANALQGQLPGIETGGEKKGTEGAKR